jgi:hypothetical protein
MNRRHRRHVKHRRRGVAAPLERPSLEPSHVVASPDDIDIVRPRVLDESPPIDLDRLVPEVGPAGSDEARLREPPKLIVEGPDGAARRRARDERDGVEPADPRRGPLYIGIALFVALLVFAVLSLIEMGEALAP